MQGADYLLVIVLVVSLILGFVRGFVREAILLIAWMVGIWAAWHFAYLLSPYLGGMLAHPGVQEWAGRVIVLVGVLIIGAGLASLAAYITQKAVGLAITDRLLGGVFGLARGIVIIGVFTIAGRALELQSEPWWERSKMMPYAQMTANWLQRYAEPAVAELIDAAADKAGK